MASSEAQRIQSLCQLIWGDGDYDLDLETDDRITYYVVVKKDYGTSFGPLLMMTGICHSEDHAWGELDRMLNTWAKQKLSGRPMTDDELLDIFGGPNGVEKPLLKKCLAMMKEINDKRPSCS